MNDKEARGTLNYIQRNMLTENKRKRYADDKKAYEMMFSITCH